MEQIRYKLRTWFVWDNPVSSLQLDSGEVVEVNPGDKLLVDYNFHTREILQIIEHKERLLN